MKKRKVLWWIALAVFAGCAVWLVLYAVSANRDAQSLQSYQDDLALLSATPTAESPTAAPTAEAVATQSDQDDLVLTGATPTAEATAAPTATAVQATAQPMAYAAPSASAAVSVATAEPVATQDPVLAYYQELAAKNPDMAGWIRIEDTVVDYPVMHTPENEEKYLHKDFDGNYSNAGLPFMDDQCDPDNPTLSRILFGHNMRSGQMFAVLHQYMDKDFFKAHAAIQMDTLNSRTTYQAVALLPLLLTEMQKPSMACYQPVDTSVQENVDAFNAYLEEYARILDGKIERNDQVLVLSTCAYASGYNRLVLIARAPAK
ncbi:MAG: class B sortase [Clostridiales bacterium]|nr:class B sortase [Clostridiales bacterium]